METKIKVGVLTADLTAPFRTREDALAECDRELHVRIRCFPDWVNAGKLSMGEAKTRLESMARACQLLAVIHALADEQWAALESSYAVAFSKASGNSEPSPAA